MARPIINKEVLNPDSTMLFQRAKKRGLAWILAHEINPFMEVPVAEATLLAAYPCRKRISADLAIKYQNAMNHLFDTPYWILKNLNDEAEAAYEERRDPVFNVTDQDVIALLPLLKSFFGHDHVAFEPDPNIIETLARRDREDANAHPA